MAKLSYFLLLALFATSSALANQVLTKGTKILGKQFSVTEQQGSVATGNGVNALTQVTFFGKAIPLLSSAVDYTVASGQINQKNNELYVKSIAIIQVLKEMGGIWKLVSICLSCIPNYIRDIVYDFIAKNRYQWFGSVEECLLMKGNYSSRFLD